ncbi:DUF4870 domain-containing protein [Ahniella affigens]|uniref:DUF4870 domain-containing protein n=1 Tax=Ahniella affigens TaxID=2021234 RepID=A0A2P1PNK5_9GAMM|nr:DUF4870 domain-containing protein [Ahniella affigens]AVP96422.1 DUF4870 domain-containing protein [Ahniella affigens]
MTDPNSPIAPPPAPALGSVSNDDKLWGMLAHLSALLFGFLGPLVVWLVKKNESAFVDDQGKEALNFQITVFIAMLACGVLSIVIIGLFLMPIVGLGALVLTIMAGIKANGGETYRYPFAIRLIK